MFDSFLLVQRVRGVPASFHSFHFCQIAKDKAMIDDKGAFSLTDLTTLIGRAWAPAPPCLDSRRIRDLADRGLSKPSDLSPFEIQELSASIVSHLAHRAKDPPC